MNFPPSPFWDFSLATYGRAGVAPACLALQDRHGVDVNLLLYACWAGSRGVRLTGAEIARLVAASGLWHAEIVRPLRTIRRRLKSGTTAPPGLAEALRQRVLAVELDAEHVEQMMLAGALDLPDGRDGAGAPEHAASNLAAYGRNAGIAWQPRDTGALAALLQGGFPDRAPAVIRQLADSIPGGSL